MTPTPQRIPIPRTPLAFVLTSLVGSAMLLALPMRAAQLASVPVHSVAELSFTGPTVRASDNPVRSIDFTVTFRHESGSLSFKIHGFWDGDGQGGPVGNVWKVRFCPTRAGRWDIIETASNRAELRDEKRGDSVAATTSQHPGFWEVDSAQAGSRWFKRSNGTHPYIVGNTHYDFLFRPKGFEATAASIRSDVAANATYFKKLRFCLMSPRTENTSQLKPFLDSNGTPTDNETEVPNPKFFRERVDAAVAEGWSKDLICDLILGGSIRQQTPSLLGYLKYVAARYGSYPNVWFCIGQEWNEQDSAADQKQIGTTFRGFLPYPSPVSTHGTGAWHSDLNGAWHTHSIRQRKSEDLGSAAGGITEDYAANGGKPAVNDENGYDPGEATTPDVIEGIVGSFLGGGYGTTGHKTASKEGGYFWGHAALGRSITEHPSIDELAFLRSKIEALTEFWRMTPRVNSASIFSASSKYLRVLEWSGNQYILGTDTAFTGIRATLPPGGFRVIQLDIINKSERILAQNATGTYTFNTPNSRAVLTLFLRNGTSPNQAPLVNAGSDQSLVWPANLVTLSGTASDDGLPSGSLAVSWRKASGPGTVTFAQATSLRTTATFSAPGTYSLELVASDSQLTSVDGVTVLVSSGDTSPSITTVSSDLSRGQVGVAYSDDIEADGGEAPLTWSLVAGSLPPGVAISGSTFEGTPTAAGTFTFTLRVTDADGDSDDAALSLVIDSAPSTGFQAKINFQPPSAAVPANYTADSGQTFAARNGLRYGWSFDVSNTARIRSRDSDPRFDTLIHLQKTGNATWEIEVPNGTYRVLIVSGDPSYTDQINHLNLEGTVLTDPDGGDRRDEYSAQVTVRDGRLTLAPAAGASNAKVCYIEISAVSP